MSKLTKPCIYERCILCIFYINEYNSGSREAYLDSILKIRDITLPTKVHIVKAMVFPAVMYGCESWTIKKGEPEELMLSNCGAREDS